MDDALALFARLPDSPYCRFAAKLLHISFDHGLTREELVRLYETVDEIHQGVRTRQRTYETRGLTRGRFIDLADAFRQAEPASELPVNWRDGWTRGGDWWAEAHPPSASPPPPPGSAAGRRIVVELYLRGMEPDEIDWSLGLPAGTATAAINGAGLRPNPEKCRQIVTEHYRGHYLSVVARHVGVGHDTVTAVLSRIDEEPRTDPKRVEGKLVRQRIRALSDEHPNAGFREIASMYKRRFGGEISVDQFKNSRRGRPRGA